MYDQTIFDDKYINIIPLAKTPAAEVVKGYDRNLKKTVVIKRVLKVKVHSPEYFKREFDELMQLEHPHIVKVHNFGETSQYFYYTMDCCEGSDLANTVLDFREPRIITTLAYQILAGLDYIHRRGIIHGDIKPSNIFVKHTTPNYHFVLGDFGLIRVAQRRDNPVISGTVEYIAPEVFQGVTHDPRSDLYSLGLMLFYLLTGRYPFQPGDDITTVKTSVKYEYIGLRTVSPRINRGFADLVDGLLRHNPAERIASAYDALILVTGLLNKYSIKIPPTLGGVVELSSGKLIGYEDEMHMLRTALFARGTSARGFFLRGPHGAGKTMLLAEVGKITQLEGGAYYYVDCEKRSPIAGGLYESFNGTDYARSELNKTIRGQGVGSIGADLISGVDIRLDEERAIQHNIKSNIRERGFAFFAFDNVNTSNALLISSVKKLTAALNEEKALFAWAIKPGNDDASDHFEADVLATLNGGEPPRRLLLQGYDADTTLEYLKYLLGTSAVNTMLFQYVIARGKGNPLAIRRIIGSLMAQGVLTRGPEGWSFDSRRVDESKVFSATPGAWDDCLVGLNVDEENGLYAAAAYGYDFPVGLLSSEATTSSLLNRGLIVKSRGLGGGYNFANPEFLAFVQNRIKKSGLVKPFADVVSYLEQNPTPLINELAVKANAYSQLGDNKRARACFLQSAETAAERLEYGETIRLLESARTTPGPWLRGIYNELLETLAGAYAAFGNHEKARDCYRALLRRVRPEKGNAASVFSLAKENIALGDFKSALKELSRVPVNTLRGDTRFAYYSLSAWAHYRARDVKRAVSYAALASKYARRQNRDDLRACADYIRGLIAVENREYRQALLCLKRAVKIWTQAKNYRLVISANNVLGNLYVKRGDLCRSEDTYKRNIALCRDASDVYNLVLAYLYVGHLHYWQGSVREADGYYEQALAECKNTGNLVLLAVVYIYAAANMTRAGEYRKAEFYIGAASRLRTDLSSLEGDICYNKGQLYFEIGKWKEALRYADRAEEYFAERATPVRVADALLLRGRIYCALGDLDRAEKALAAGRASLRGTDDDLGRAKALTLGAELARCRGDAAEAARSDAQAKATFAKRGSTYFVMVAELSAVESGLEALRNAPTSGNVKTTERRLAKVKSSLREAGINKFQNRIAVLEKELYIMSVKRNHTASEPFTDLAARVKTLSEQKDISGLLKYILSFLIKELDAERGVIFLYDAYRNVLRISGTAGLDDTTLEDASAISQTIVNQVASSRAGLVSADATHDFRFKNNTSVRLNRIRSLMCIPITIGDDLLGVIYLDSLSRDALFVDRDLSYAGIFIQNAAYEIERQQRKTEARYVAVSVPGDKEYGLDRLVGSSTVVKELKSKIEIAATSAVNVLLTGESGTGKDLVAKLIHCNSPNADRPFIAIHCAAIPETLLESELFGIEKGTATGVDKRIGRFEQAGEGAVFLDEIGTMDVNTQAKLLRILQEKQFDRLGSRTANAVPFKARIISATNADLAALRQSGRFREDLFFRLNVFAIHIPPLRDRKEDIPELLDHLLSIHNPGGTRPVPRFSKRAFEMLRVYNWPGNIRELDNCVQFALANSRGTPLLDEKTLPTYIVEVRSTRRNQPAALSDAVACYERELIVAALREADGVKARAAKKLGISESNLRYKMVKYGITGIEKDNVPLHPQD